MRYINKKKLKQNLKKKGDYSAKSQVSLRVLTRIPRDVPISDKNQKKKEAEGI